MADVIHQLYCTHCTYGTAALHRNEGQIAQQVFEYSSRAVSVSIPRERSHDYFRRIEPVMFFHMPGDAPSTELLRQTADSIRWKRLLYFPAIDGQRMAAHICHRQTDTRGRPGSYFAHVLLSEAASSTWSGRDAARLWGCPSWVRTDGSHLSFDLPSMSSLDELVHDSQPLIGDATLLSFLRTPRGGSFVDESGSDAASVIPERWREKPPEERQKWLKGLLRATLELKLERQERVILVVEPSVAALLFFGVFRLLPRKGLAGQLSFSTFESHIDRPLATLSAFDFMDPNRNDLPPTLRRTPGFVANTYLAGSQFDTKNRDAKYADFIVNELITRGFQRVDETLADLEASEISSPNQLDGIADSHQRLTNSLLPPYSIDGDWPSEALPYVRRVAARAVVKMDGEQIRVIAGSIAGQRLLDLVGADVNGPDSRPAVEALLRKLPRDEGVWNNVLGLPNLHAQFKSGWLAELVERNGGHFPSCPAIWKPSEFQTGGTLNLTLQRLNAEQLKQALPSVPRNALPSFLALAGASTAQDKQRRRLLAEAIGELDDESLIAVLTGPAGRSSALLQVIPWNDTAFYDRLLQMGNELGQKPDGFGKRLEFLLIAQEHSADLKVDLKPTVGRWDSLKNAFTGFMTAEEPKAKLLGKSDTSDFDKAAQRLSESVKNLLGAKTPFGAATLTKLRSASTALLGSGEVEPFMRKVKELLIPWQLRSVRDSELCEFMYGQGEKWLREYNVDAAGLRTRLERILKEIPDHPKELGIRVQGLAAVSSLLADRKDELRVWQTLVKQLRELNELRQAPGRADPHDLSGSPQISNLLVEIAQNMGKVLKDVSVERDPKTNARRLKNASAIDKLVGAINPGLTISGSKYLNAIFANSLK